MIKSLKLLRINNIALLVPMAWNYDVHILAASPEFDLYPVWKSYNDGCSIIVHLQLEFSPFFWEFKHY